MSDVDWLRTAAYGLGFNGLYLNMKGRERDGWIEPGDQREALLAELRRGYRDTPGAIRVHASGTGYQPPQRAPWDAAPAGVDVLVHGIGDADVDPELIEIMKAKGTVYVSTLAVYEFKGALERPIRGSIRGSPPEFSKASMGRTPQ